jgi:hypothetical protein
LRFGIALTGKGGYRGLACLVRHGVLRSLP